jgi:hypothetical protein
VAHLVEPEILELATGQRKEDHLLVMLVQTQIAKSHLEVELMRRHTLVFQSAELHTSHLLPALGKGHKHLALVQYC